MCSFQYMNLGSQTFSSFLFLHSVVLPVSLVLSFKHMRVRPYAWQHQSKPKLLCYLPMHVLSSVWKLKAINLWTVGQWSISMLYISPSLLIIWPVVFDETIVQGEKKKKIISDPLIWMSKIKIPLKYKKNTSKCRLIDFLFHL